MSLTTTLNGFESQLQDLPAVKLKWGPGHPHIWRMVGPEFCLDSAENIKMSAVSAFKLRLMDHSVRSEDRTWTELFQAFS